MSIQEGVRAGEGGSQESDTVFRAIFNSVQAGIVVIDPKTHCIVDANPSPWNLSGRRVRG